MPRAAPRYMKAPRRGCFHGLALREVRIFQQNDCDRLTRELALIECSFLTALKLRDGGAGLFNRQDQAMVWALVSIRAIWPN